ncbi:MAG: hypothetical protein GY739_05325, partial [Mesoflavibacter sp.]|nr:hypothetical protein [Mesoflavibacter sp.]
MGILKKKKLHLFTSLDTLKILTFWKILKDRNIMMLDFDYYDGKKYSKEQEVDIAHLWERLYDEYYLLRNHKKSIQKLDSGFKELMLQDKINNVALNHDFLVNLLSYSQYLGKDETLRLEQKCYSIITTIDKRIKVKYFEGIQVNIDNLKRVLKSLQNTYNLNYAKQDAIVKDEIKNVYEVVANMEQWLGK